LKANFGGTNDYVKKPVWTLKIGVSGDITYINKAGKEKPVHIDGITQEVALTFETVFNNPQTEYEKDANDKYILDDAG